jgi:hypothetical protein
MHYENTAMYADQALGGMSRIDAWKALSRIAQTAPKQRHVP